VLLLRADGEVCKEDADFMDLEWYANDYQSFSGGEQPATCCRKIATFDWLREFL